MPRVPDGFEALLHHYRFLSRRRSSGFGVPNPIDFVSIFIYNQTIARLDLEFFCEVIDMLDDYHLSSIAKSSKGAAGAKKTVKTTK